MDTESQKKEQEKEQEQELALYNKLRERMKALLGDIKDQVDLERINQAVDKARQEIEEVGGHTVERINRVAASLKKDMLNAAERLGPKWENFSDKTADIFGVWRDRSSQFLAQGAMAMGEWLQQLSDELKQQRYHTGDMASGGTFKCTSCGEHLVLNKPGHIPPCPACFKTEFQRL